MKRRCEECGTELKKNERFTCGNCDWHFHQQESHEAKLEDLDYFESLDYGDEG